MKKLAVGFITLPMLAAFLLNAAPVRSSAAGVQDKDLATVFKESKCLICHGAKAEKKFDASLPEDQMVDAIMKGKKGEKPPNMPGYEAKGMTVDQAKALVAYMKSLRQ